MTDADSLACAHVDGHRAGMSGRPEVAPDYDSLVLAAAWVRGWRIGRARRVAAPVTPDEGRAPSPEAVSDAVPVAVPSSSGGVR